MVHFENQDMKSILDGSLFPAQWGQQMAPDRSKEKLGLPLLMIIASDADRAMTVREWDPVDQLNGHTLIDICTHPFNLEAPGDMVPVGPRSLTVTALSSGEGCLASSWLKFQPSPASGCARHGLKMGC